MKLASIIARFTRPQAPKEAVFEQRLQKMTAPTARPRRSKPVVAPSAFRFSRATA
ncbi:MAG: hypothetical protein ACOY5U_01770 [Pseudomonadota bacterium]|jgi:hypothetical protein